MYAKTLTIVIPTYNESKYIGRTLLEIAKQSGTYGVQIIIADANSTDNTREIIKSTASKLKLKVRIIRGGLPAIGRNEGAARAITPYVLFVDADVTFTNRHSIKFAMQEIIDNQYHMISTNPVYKGESDIRAYTMFKLNKLVTMFMAKISPFAIGAFTLVDRSVFESLGGYDTKAYQSEDWLLSRQIDTTKFKIIPDLITQDNRRFKRYGYWSMIRLLFVNWVNRNNTNHFYKDNGYWK
jgi:glycosyltransferase involved in cell wall biosynthesis